MKNAKQQNHAHKNRILVLGGGSFGTAMAHILSKQYPVTLWTRNQKIAKEINTNNTNNQYLPGVALSPYITATYTLTTDICEQYIIIAVPSFAVKQVINQLPKSTQANAHYFLITSKGLDPHTGQTLTDICKKAYPNSTMAALVGPNYAKELACEQHSIAVLGCDNSDKAKSYVKLFNGTNLHILTTNDLTGIQLASTYKHVAAIYHGVCDALNTNQATSVYNCKAYFLHAYWRELHSLIKIYHGQVKTMYLSPILGDLIVSCSQQSRNYRLGFLLITKPHSPECKKLSQECEGPWTVKTLNTILSKNQLAILPLLRLLNNLLQAMELKENLCDKSYCIKSRTWNTLKHILHKSIQR